MTLWHYYQDGGSNPPISTKDLRVGEMVTRLVHTQKIGGSIPPPATKVIEYGSVVLYTTQNNSYVL